MINLEKKIKDLVNLYKSNHLSEAEITARKLISSYPKIVFLYNILGLILTDQNKIDEAISFFKNALEIKPDYAEIYNNMGTAYKLKKKYERAEAYYKKSIKLNSKLPETYNNLGNLYVLTDRFEEAVKHFKTAINISPNFFVAYYSLGTAYISLGRLTEASANLNKAIKLHPKLYSAHRALSQIKKYKNNDNHLITLRKLYDDPLVKIEEKTELAFALGKAYEDIKNFDESFKYYKSGNFIRRKNVDFSLTKEKEKFNSIKKKFNENFFKKFNKSGYSDSTAIFILGMPRSGTTLAEQIISSHPNVYGGNELNYLNDIVNNHFPNFSTSDSFEKIDAKNLKELGSIYIENIRNLSKVSKRVTDKNPSNFKWIGLIKMILPNSKIVLCSRNARDNCFSIYKNFFSSTELNYAYNLNEISEYYLLYYDLIKYWKKLLPNFIYDFFYEDVIKNPTQNIKNLLMNCNLKWNDSCLEFYNNKRPVKTASHVQVRKKIYNTSVNSWTSYENYLKDFFDQLPK